MKVLMITRLMSGFADSIKSKKWRPAGAPAIYRMIDALDKSCKLSILFTLKDDELVTAGVVSLEGLSVKPKILSGSQSVPKIFGPFRTYLSEVRQCWVAYRHVKKNKLDVVYIDRANVLLGAVIARFTKTPVHLRLLGTPPSLNTLLTKPALSHYLYRWAYRSPFKMVLCSRDGSPGEGWMARALDAETPRKRWVNGVDSIVELRSYDSLIEIVLIGRLNPLKRIDEAVDAILNLPSEYLKKIHVDIIGDGEQFERIQEKVKNHKNFKMHGAIPHEDVLQRLLQSDILISLNSHGNLTNTVLEAIRCSLCLMLPEPDLNTGIDVDTYTVIPNDAAIQLSRDNLSSDLTQQLQRLIDEPVLIQRYQDKTRQISSTIDTWDQRIAREVDLLKPYDMAIVISDLQGGGTQRVLERLLKQWVLQGKRIVVVTLDFPENDKVQLPDMVDRISLGGIAESKNPLMGMLANLRRVRAIRRTLKRLRAPVVISFLSAMNVLTALATRRLPCRLIISERNDPTRQSVGRIWDMLRKKCYRYADVVTANSHSAIKTMTQFVNESQCHYVPNPVVLPENIEPVALTKPTIVAVGRLHHQKAYDVLLNAFHQFHKSHPEWQLLILGEGAERAALENRIRQLQLEGAVELKGYVDPFPYLAAADVYTMPSRYEGMPNALLEAMALAKPSVISDALTGPLDFIKDQHNALVVPVENADALSNALSTLAEQPELRESLSLNAKAAVAEFSLDSVLPQWEVLFDA